MCSQSRELLVRLPWKATQEAGAVFASRRDAGVRMDSVGERSTFHCKLFDILNLFTCTCYLF